MATTTLDTIDKVISEGVTLKNLAIESDDDELKLMVEEIESEIDEIIFEYDHK